MSAQTTVVKLTWEDISTGDTDETGQELDIYTDSASFVPTVLIDYASARHPWMRLPPLAAGVETMDLPLKTPVTFVKFRVRQYNANGPGPWSLARVVTIAQAVGVLVPQAPINLGGVVSGGTVTPPPPPVDPPPPPPPTGGGGASSNYAFTAQYSGTQGGNQWSYLTANDALLSYNAVSGLWNGAQLYQSIWNGGIHPGPTEGTKLRWTAPAAGTAIIGGSVALLTSAGSNGVTLEIEHEGSSIAGPTSLTTTAPITINETVVVLAGDVIDFIVAPISGNSYCSTSLAPSIQFTTDGVTPALPIVSSLLPATLTISVGGQVALTVALSSAPSAAAVVSLSSSDATKATVPATVSVPAGQTSANIPVTGVAAGSSTITATYNSSNKTAAVTVSNPASSSWTNAPAGGTVLIDSAFDDINGFIDDYPVAGSHIETISDAPFSPSKALVHRLYPLALTGGGQLRCSSAPTRYREMYIGLRWRTNPQFQGRTVGNKLFFIRGAPPISNGVFLFHNTSLSNGQGQMLFATNTYGIDNPHILGASYVPFWPNVGNGTLTRGVWHKLEAWVRCSTTRTARDGAVKWWVNDNLVGYYEGINYCGPNGEFNDEICINETWDGAGDMGSVNTVTWEHVYDHCIVVGKN